MINFALYSQYYDLLYEDKDYQSESDYVNALIQEYKPSASSILDIGCGTGLHATALAMKGYSVTGVDMSKTMLDNAVNRKGLLDESISNKLDFQLGDARTYRGNLKYDVVVSLFHVFSYQTTDADLQATFETAAYHLKPGGILIFDYWYGPAVLTQIPEVRVKRLQNDKCKVIRIAEPTLFPTKNVVNVNYWMLIDSLVSEESERVTEAHTMRYLFIPEIEAFSSKNFRSLDHFAWMTRQSPTIYDWAGLSILEHSE
jgi:SAM-dependent methyltransferase